MLRDSLKLQPDAFHSGQVRAQRADGNTVAVTDDNTVAVTAGNTVVITEEFEFSTCTAQNLSRDAGTSALLSQVKGPPIPTQFLLFLL